MLEADPELTAALGEAERVHTSLTRLGGRDLTDQVTSWSLDRAYDSDLPAPMRATNGSAAAELRLTLSGTDTQTAAQLYSPYAPHATADIARPRQSVLHGWGLAEDALPAFRGLVRDRSADSGTGQVELSALDGAERLRGAARLPVAVSVNTVPIASGVWIVDSLLRDADIHTAPPPRPECIFYSSMHGGIAPDIGFYRTHSGSIGYLRDRAPWEMAALPGATTVSFTVRWDPRTRTTVPGRNLWTEMWVDTSAIGPDTGTAFLSCFYQADGATNSVEFGVDFKNNRATAATDGGTVVIFFDTLPLGRWHLGCHWSFTGTQPTARIYMSGPGGFYREFDPGTLGRLPASGTQLNYVSLTAGVPVEAVQVAMMTFPPTRAQFEDYVWQRGAVLDAITSTLTAIPPTEGSAWEVIGAVAQAEQATASFDEHGIFRYRNNSRFTTPGTPVLTAASAREIASLQVSEAIDSVRNVIDVPYSIYTSSGTTRERFTETVRRSIPGFSSLTLTYDYDVTEYDSPPPIAYVTTTPSTTSRVRWATVSDGSGGVHGQVESTTERDGAQMRITFRNTGSATVFMVTSANVASLSIYSVELATGSPSRRSLRRTDTTSVSRYGPQVYQVPATPWLQTSTAASSVAAYLLAVASSPLPVLGDVEILPDPRIQLGDLVRITDTVGAALTTPAWVVGIRTNGDDQGRVRQVLTLRATLSPGPPFDAGLSPDPLLDPGARAVLLGEGIRVP
ncbi:hypothetical protein ACFFQW_45215 [Umezawaea endophytica]|uniref:Uncharacterized protein n=1 Tax=Umezawaea endophytica TaxID=1654476 RepID=A0A9X3A7R0_9PSEU|nr:hypothetical protein [Umezawaea endophytica]MCS7484648.1 hypothetical protein [Umezawaea endophytica]